MSAESSTDTTRPAPESNEQPDSKKQKTESTRSSPKYSLYSYWRSGASWRVRVAFAYKGLEYEYIPINLLKSEQSSDSFALLNPQRKVPLLVIDDGCEKKKNIAQSLAIIDYLDNAHPDTPNLLPKDPYLRAKAWNLAEGVNADTQPLQNLPALNRVNTLAGETAKNEWAVWAIGNGLKALEAGVQDTAGKYCVGDDITIADLCLVPQLAAARRFNVDLTPYPTLVRIEAECNKHPAFQKGHPNNQPDKPADIVI